MTRIRAVAPLLVLLTALANDVAFADDLRTTPLPQTSATATAPVPQTPPKILQLPPDVKEVADITGVYHLMEHLSVEEVAAQQLPPHSMELVEKKERILYLRQRIMQALQTAFIEIGATRGKIDSASAALADAQAVLN